MKRITTSLSSNHHVTNVKKLTVVGRFFHFPVKRASCVCGVKSFTRGVRLTIRSDNLSLKLGTSFTEYI